MSIKKNIWKEIDKRKKELIDLCCELVKIPTENPPGEMETITNFICTYFNEHGVENKVYRPKPNKPNIVAEYGKDNGKKLIFNGHADVVPAGDLSKWDFNPYCGDVKDGKILGRGTSDMKAGLGSAIFVMCLLAELNIPLDGKLFLTIVPDEEISGELGTKWIVENGIVSGDACVVAEPTGYDNCEVGQKGTLWVKFKAEGVSAHGSLSPYVGDNAIVKLIKVLDEIKCLTGLHGEYEGEVEKVIKESKIVAKESLNKIGVENIIDHVTVNIGRINGGTKTNMVPDTAEADVDIRIPLGVSTQIVIDAIDKIINGLPFEGITYTYSWRSEPNNVSINSDIVKAVKRNAKDVLGIDISATYQWASSDARYFRYAGIPTIQYGPANTEGIHSYNETVDIKDVINSAKIYAGIIVDMLVDD